MVPIGNNGGGRGEGAGTAEPFCSPLPATAFLLCDAGCWVGGPGAGGLPPLLTQSGKGLAFDDVAPVLLID